MNRAATVATWLRSSVRPLRVRLTLWYVALLAVILIGFSAALYARLASGLQVATDRSLEAEAHQVLATLDLQNGVPTLADAPDDLPAGTIVALYDASGTLRSTSAQSSRMPTLPSPAAAGLATIHDPNGEDWRVLTTPISEGGHAVGTLQVAQSERQTEAALGQLALLMAVAIPLTLVLAIAGGLFLASRALDPIDRVTRTARRIGAEDLSRRLALPPSDDEVGRLATTFDDMLDRLERAFQRQRRFTADASHELRTPLALLTSEAEVALERPRKAAEYRETLSAIREEAQRMNRLLSELLTLARAENGREVLAREPVELHLLVADVLAALEPLAGGRSVRLERGVEEPVVVVGDQARLTQLVVNVVDNAIKYSREGGVVRVTVAQDGQCARLSVADTGAGIAPEHLPHLFERFYRVDAARSRGDGGTGLGLAIAHWIVQAHGGRIDVASTVGEGTTFTVRLPMASVDAERYARRSVST